MNFESAVSIIIKNEGGYVNDPDDPGGETKWGISKRVFPEVDIKALTDEKARSLYFTHYWIPGKCSLLPERLRLIYFDMCVLYGIHGAVVVLQKAINGKGYAIGVDGVIGEETIKAASDLEPDRLRSYRILRIANIVLNRSSQEKYWYGWYRRAIQV